jgi:hypothetical protein
VTAAASAGLQKRPAVTEPVLASPRAAVTGDGRQGTVRRRTPRSRSLEWSAVPSSKAHRVTGPSRARRRSTASERCLPPESAGRGTNFVTMTDLMATPSR